MQASPSLYRLPATGFAFLVLSSLLWLGPAGAAVRLCEATVSSGPVRGPNESTARAAALAIWKSKAQKHGEPYASWRIGRESTAVPAASGRRCGMPCERAALHD